MSRASKPTARIGARRGRAGHTRRSRPRESFKRATAVRAVADRRYLAEVRDGWSVASGPSGGYLAAIAVRALLADQPGVLRSLCLSYLRAPDTGALELEVRPLHAGRTVRRCALTAEQSGAIVFAGTATFTARELPNVARWCTAPPDVAPAPGPNARAAPWQHYRPDESHWLELAPDLPPVIHRARLAPRFGSGRFSGADRDEAGVQTGGWMVLRNAARIDPAYLAMCADLWWPAALEPVAPGTTAPTLELAVHFRKELPAAGIPREPILAHFRAPAAVEGLVDEDGALFLAGGTLLAQVRQLSLLRPAR